MNTRIFKLIFTLTLGSLIISSCLKDDFLNSDRVPQAGFTMINVYPGTDFIIHKADNNYIQTMNNPLQFKGINFVSLYPGNRKIQTIDKANTSLIDSTYSIKDSVLYTSFVYSKPNAKAAQHLIEDKLLDNLASNSAFRFLNLAYNQPIVNLYIDDAKVIENRVYDGNLVADHYKFVSTASGLKKITVKNQANETLAERQVNLTNSMHYSIILVKLTAEDKYELIVHQQYRN